VKRLFSIIGQIARLRTHDVRAARTWLNTMYPQDALLLRLLRFLGWAVNAIFVLVPRTGAWTSFEKPISRIPIWLSEGNPFVSHPESPLPDEADVVVIGAGLVGAALAYHWSKLAGGRMVVVEKHEPAWGAAGRNEGLVVMGRYYFYVVETVLAYLRYARADLGPSGQESLAHEFAEAYSRAAYANAEMIAETIAAERIDCEYLRCGWVQVPAQDQLKRLDASVEIARQTGFTDWTKISSAEIFEGSGLKTNRSAGFSVGAATWNPAKWVWALMGISLTSQRVQLSTRTAVVRVEDAGGFYRVHTARGVISAPYVVNATESHTPTLFPAFHNIIQPKQTQAAFGASDGGTMKGGIGISTDRAFYGKHRDGVLFGSDATRVPDSRAGSNHPSRFITNFVLTEMQSQFGVQRMHVTHEWSGTVSYTPDEFPLVGLMDGKRLYMIGGMAGSGSGVSFNAARHIVQKILKIDGPDYYPEKYFSPARFLQNPGWNTDRQEKGSRPSS
jgi:glycine/D-amino acid oxidase-like deaminating enzyme